MHNSWKASNDNKHKQVMKEKQKVKEKEKGGKKRKSFSGCWFRSSDLEVMGLARFLCAKPLCPHWAGVDYLN